MNPVSSIKRHLVDYLLGRNSLARPAIRFCIENGLFPGVLTRTPSSELRSLLHLPAYEHTTQLNQDVFALLINRFRPGYFLEIGANDGFTLSNTVYLEEHFQWTGALIEANPKYAGSLRRRLQSKILNVAVASVTGEADFVDAGLYGGLSGLMDATHADYTAGAPVISVPCLPLNAVLDEIQAPGRIDFVSIDVEGGELPIVEQMTGGSTRYRCGCIETNRRADDRKTIIRLLEASGYQAFWDGLTEQDLFFVDIA